MTRTLIGQAALCLTPLLVASCAKTIGNDYPAQAPMSGNIGGVALGEADNAATTKVIVASFEFTATGVTPRGAIAAFGGSRPPASRGSDFHLQLVDGGGAVLHSYMIGNPRSVIVHGEGVREVERSVYAARFPFVATAREARVASPQGAVLARQDVTVAIGTLCERARTDPDCARVPR